VGRLEARLRKLEEADARVGFTVAMQRLDDEESAVLLAYLKRWESFGGERVPSPRPTPEEAVVLRKLHDLRRQAIREGWGDSSYRTY
jgi:hypothetical protein